MEIKKIAELLEEVDSILELASQIQVEGYDFWDRENKLKELDETYANWYQSGQAQIRAFGEPEHFKKFNQLYDGTPVLPKIKRFTRHALTQMFNAKKLKETTSPNKWSYPFDRSFKEPFLAQKDILMTIDALLYSKKLKEQERQYQEKSEKDNIFTSYNFHPRVVEESEALFNDEHYKQATLEVYIAIVQAVKNKSGRHDLDNSKLMQEAFSANSPILKLSDDKDEQLGFMWLFSGAVMAIRNPRAHKLLTDNKDTCLKFLALASLLFELLDNAEKVQKKN